jgi:hypothetical protein
VNVVVEHNTAFQTGAIIIAEGAPHAGFVYRYNITPHSEYGVKGAGSGIGLPTLAQYFPGAAFVGNVLTGRPAYERSYPPGNHFPATIADTGFRNVAAGDYRLADTSPHKRAAAGGADIGVDFDALELSQGQARSTPGPRTLGEGRIAAPGGTQ